ncbi:YicC/YloC family endoribonuclease [Roseivirga sp. BDSF3-8]|uniref:YicC/YloC family endoribonuclease n=1 Tax=Roseivirga sp. BDSF3-8 TaxID=3241598 RepID=UPI003532548B
MIRSMTGFGLVQFENEKLLITAEVKSLNSKFLDPVIKLPRVFAEKELEVKNLLTTEMERGKVMVNLDYQRKDQANTKFSVNKELFHAYYKTLTALAREVGGGSNDDIFRVALNSPEVMMVEKDQEGQTEDWPQVEEVLRQAVQKCNQFRAQEGEALYKMLVQSAVEIESLLEQVKQRDPARVENIKSRIKGNLEEFVGQDKVDENRFEQELIYYIEKLDINEEKVRLQNHLEYFRKVLSQGGVLGKKLGFISQEIGREINTIGSKANDSDIQRYVVNMKEELEKIKEQVLNVL